MKDEDDITGYTDYALFMTALVERQHYHHEIPATGTADTTTDTYEQQITSVSTTLASLDVSR
jgi:hypothetical protein